MHGIHSPFVYNFASKCLSKKKTVDSSKISSYLASLKSNKSKIIVSDFGAGSRVFKSNNRSIDKIALNSGITQKRAILIANITNYFQPNKVLEIGTSLGIATASMSSGYPKAKIITLEGCNETAKIAQEYFVKFNLNNIELIVGEFGNTLPLILKKNSFDLIFFDGNHQKEATIHYFEQCLINKRNDTIYIFDDIHWSKEMEVAWDIIKNHSEVTISIDTYQWGIVFFRKEQPKEHFIIRV